MNTRQYICSALVSVAMFGAVACGGHDPHAAASGGTLVISASGDADNLFPPLTLTSQGRQVTDQIFDYLADIGPGLNTIGDAGFTPRLAQSWKWAPDSLSIAFRINPRARWHDGSPVTASDVRFTYRLVVDTALGSPVAATLIGVDSVSVADSLTAVVWFRHRSPEQFFDLAYNLAILPEHILGTVPVRSLASSPFARSPIGSGRFRFGRWDGGTRIELVSDSSNYRGRAKLDRVLWMVSPDMTTATTRFLAGEADFIDVVRGPTVQQIGQSPRLRLMTLPSLDYGYLGFNTKRPLFRDRELRRALSMVVDRDAMVRNVFDTLAQPGLGPLVRAQTTASAAIAPLRHDSAAAATTLRGHSPVAFHLMVPTSSAIRMRYAVLLQAQYRKAGVAVTVDPLDINAFAQRLNKGDWDAVLNAWHTDPSPSAVRQAWSGAALPPHGANFTGYSSASFDATVDSAAATFGSDRSRSLYQRAYAIINADAPAVWLYEARSASGVGRRVNVVGARPDQWWADLPDWTVRAR